MKDVLAEIIRLRLQRNRSEYELAQHSGLTQSTISKWYRKKQIPTIQTLEKVCCGFGITLSQFFALDDDVVSLTEEQKDLLDCWATLTNTQQVLFPESVLKPAKRQIEADFFCQARRFDAGILTDFKSNKRSPGGKRHLKMVF